MDLKDNNKSNPERKHGNQSSPTASSHALRDFVPAHPIGKLQNFSLRKGFLPPKNVSERQKELSIELRRNRGKIAHREVPHSEAGPVSPLSCVSCHCVPPLRLALPLSLSLSLARGTAPPSLPHLSQHNVRTVPLTVSLSRVCSVALIHELRGQSDLQLAVTSAKPQRTQPFLIELLRSERVSNSSRCPCHAITIKHCNIAILTPILVSSSLDHKLNLKSTSSLQTVHKPSKS